MTQPSPEIKNRDEFPDLLNFRGLNGIIAEIGVHRGDFSRVFFERWRGTCFLGIDDYREYYPFAKDREPDYEFARSVYSACPIAHLHRKSNAICARGLEFLNQKLDFVYIDACHDYASVRDDIAVWWPLISDRGILAGHDYCREFKGVRQAVDEFSAAMGTKVFLTADPPLNSWYCYKTLPENLLEAA